MKVSLLLCCLVILIISPSLKAENPDDDWNFSYGKLEKLDKEILEQELRLRAAKDKVKTGFILVGSGYSAFYLSLGLIADNNDVGMVFLILTPILLLSGSYMQFVGALEWLEASQYLANLKAKRFDISQVPKICPNKSQTIGIEIQLALGTLTLWKR